MTHTNIISIPGLVLNQQDISIPCQLTEKEAAKSFGPDVLTLFRLEGHVGRKWVPIANFHPSASNRKGRKGYFTEIITRARCVPSKVGRKSVKVIQMPVQPTELRIVQI